MAKNVSFICTPTDKPALANPPPNWEDAVVPPGTAFPHYRREAWVTTVYPSGHKHSYLWWYRAYYWLPRQKINIELLTEDNEWVVIDTFEGPQVYHAVNSLDGKPSVMRLVAA